MEGRETAVLDIYQAATGEDATRAAHSGGDSAIAIDLVVIPMPEIAEPVNRETVLVFNPCSASA